MSVRKPQAQGQQQQSNTALGAPASLKSL